MAKDCAHEKIVKAGIAMRKNEIRWQRYKCVKCGAIIQGEKIQKVT